MRDSARLSRRRRRRHGATTLWWRRNAPLALKCRRHAEFVAWFFGVFNRRLCRSRWRGRSRSRSLGCLGARELPGIRKRWWNMESGPRGRWITRGRRLPSDGGRLGLPRPSWCGRGWWSAASSWCRGRRRSPRAGPVDWRWWRWGSRVLRLGLLLLEKIDDEVLIVLYEVICEAFTSQVVAEMLSPFGVKRLEGRELGPVPIAPR